MARRLEKKYPEMLKLKLMRIKRGLTLEKLSSLSGLNKNTISQWENGQHRPRSDKLKPIADALGCDVEEII